MANEAKQFTIGGVTHDVMDVGARQLIASLQAAIDAITGGDTTTAIKTFQEVINFLDGVTDDATLVGKLNELRTLINAKYTKPNTGIPASDLASDVIPDISGKADKATTYTKTETDDAIADAIADAVEGLGGGSVESVSVNGGEPQLPDQNGNIDIESVDGITPHIDVTTGHWFVGNEDTGIDAHGLQGNSGYTGAVGELEVVEDYTEGGVGKAASAEAVKEMAIKSIPDAGSFADAYEKARANNVVFPWFLRDVDENGNPIEKMIWHNGYRKFVDAIGAEVEGQRNGLTIKVNNDCDLLLGSTTYQLTKGVNNFSFTELGWDGTSVITTFSIRERGTTTSAKNNVEEIDFGWLKIRMGNYFIDNWDSVTKVRRAYVDVNILASQNFYNCDNLVELQVKGSETSSGLTSTLSMINSCKKLEKADLKELTFNIGPRGVRPGNFYGFVTDCPLLKYIDIRNIDTEHAEKFGNSFNGCSSLKTLVIGNFANGDITEKATTMFGGVTDCTLICTTTTPPILKNCAFEGGVAQDEYDPTLDWLAYVENGVTKCRFSAIYVPTNAVTAYKTNVYVTGGTAGNTGWSKYADIIHDIAEYEGTDYNG